MTFEEIEHPKGIEIDPETLGKALSQQRLRVDINQREYAWEDSEVEDLFLDISNVMSTGRSGAEHFFGAIVVTRDKGKQPKVVDGQQRLATTVILIAAIRDYLYVNGDKPRAQALETEFLITVDTDSLEPLPHLKLSANDNPYFRKRILALPDTEERMGAVAERPSHVRIDTAANIAKKWIAREAASMREGNAYAKLKVWKDFLLERAKVIWVQVPDDITAFRIFETMNDRGLGLSAADLLKNYLFALADDDMPEAYQQWFQMQGSIESVSDDKKAVLDYLRYYWLSAKGHTTRDDLYEDVQKDVKSKASALDLVAKLKSDSILYAALLNPLHNYWNQFPESLQNAVSSLHRLRITQIRPLLLAGVRKFEKDQKELEKFFESLVNWSVRFLISGGLGGGVLEKKYGEGARELSEGKIPNVGRLTDYFIDVIPTDPEFMKNFENAQVSKVYLAKYYLSRLEAQVSPDKDGLQFEVSKRGAINLEHILPLSKKRGIEGDIARSYYTRLGNIALMQQKKNEEMGDKDYKTIKRGVLTNSGFKLTQEAGTYEDWGTAQIDARQKRLAELAVLAWPVRIEDKQS